MSSNEVLDPSLVCRMCVTNLLRFPECYSIDEEMENLILLLTSISFEDVGDKDNLMLCITCYGRLKAFESYRLKCIINQEKFRPFKQEEILEEIQEDPVNIEDAYIEYIDEIEEDQYIEDSPDEYEKLEPDAEVAVAVEKILDEESIEMEEVPSRTKSSGTDLNEPSERAKGKELYQKLLQECELCSKMIERNRMEGHLNKHKDIRPFGCPECHKKFYCRQLLRLHRTTIHTNIRIKCETCDKVFPSQRSLYAHSLRHKNRDKYQCELCEKKFNNTNSLKRHLAVHSGIRDFICVHCGVGFYRKFNLDTHIKNVHEEIKNHVCTYDGCDKKFGYARLLRDHMRKHHLKEFADEEF